MIYFAEILYNIAFWECFMNIFENHTFSDPRLPFIFHDYSFPVTYNTKRVLNWHENIEILYFKSGSATLKIGGDDLSVSAGDITIISPNLLHGVIARSRIDFYCLIIDRSFCLSNHIDTNSIAFQPCLNDNDLADELEKFAEAFSDAQNQFRHLALRASALRILSIICSRYSLQKASPSDEIHLLSAIKHSLGYIYSESHRNLSLDEIATISGLSKYYFAHEFKRLTGQTVISYLNGVRCEKAADLLATNSMSIECIAIECGFSSSSYFIRTFKKFYSVSPGEYRNRFLN